MRFSMLCTIALGAALAGCAGGAAGTKAGGDAAPVKLRLGTVESDIAPYADEVKQFVKTVTERSGGSIEIEVSWVAPGAPSTDETRSQGESEHQLATMLVDGEVDLAVVPTRAWDQLDVTSMQALQTPFLVDNLSLVDEIAVSDLAGGLMAGLDDVGVTGLALWPESLRHPLSFGAPLLTAADFTGAKMWVPASQASDRLVRAIGAEPVHPDDNYAALDAGEIDSAELGFVWASDWPSGTFTANVTLYPKLNTIAANAKVFGALSDEQQADVRSAARDTLDYVISSNATEHDLAIRYCADGGKVALADGHDLADLAILAQPVTAQLSKDADTARFIDRIRAMKETMSVDASTLPAACEPEAVDVPAATDSGAAPQSGSVTEKAFPEGVYRDELLRSFLLDQGVDADSAYHFSGVNTLTIEDGRVEWTSPNAQPPTCEGRYSVGAARISLVIDSRCGDIPAGGVVLDASWTFEDGQLRFADIKTEGVGSFYKQYWGLTTWTKTE